MTTMRPILMMLKRGRTNKIAALIPVQVPAAPVPTLQALLHAHCHQVCYLQHHCHLRHHHPKAKENLEKQINININLKRKETYISTKFRKESNHISQPPN